MIPRRDGLWKVARTGIWYRIRTYMQSGHHLPVSPEIALTPWAGWVIFTPYSGLFSVPAPPFRARERRGFLTLNCLRLVRNRRLAWLKIANPLCNCHFGHGSVERRAVETAKG